MSEVPHKPTLPTVDETDLGSILFEDIIDSDHTGRFEHFAEQNAMLLQEIVIRAIHVAFGARRLPGERPIGAVEMQKIIIDSVTFALGAIEKAMDREANDAAFDEVPPRSAELDDDQLAE